MAEPIVVGVSPSSGSPAALQWAAEEGRLRGAPLRAVLVWRPPRAPAAPAGRPPATTDPSGGPAEEAEHNLAKFVATALGDGTPVECVAVRGSPVPALLAAAADAQLLVIGALRPGRVASARAGLVAPQVVRRAPCPVVVLPR